MASMPMHPADCTVLGRSLNKIYIGLCEFCDKPMRNCEQTNLGRSCEASQKTLSNRFAVLKVGASDHDSPSGDNQPNRECNECARQDSTAKAKVPAIPRLVDDHLGDAFDIRKEVQVKDPLLILS